MVQITVGKVYCEIDRHKKPALKRYLQNHIQDIDRQTFEKICFNYDKRKKLKLKQKIKPQTNNTNLM